MDRTEYLVRACLTKTAEDNYGSMALASLAQLVLPALVGASMAKPGQGLRGAGYGALLGFGLPWGLTLGGALGAGVGGALGAGLSKGVFGSDPRAGAWAGGVPGGLYGAYQGGKGIWNLVDYLYGEKRKKEIFG